MTNTQHYLVYGGEMADLTGRRFKDPDNFEIVGIYSNYDDALKAWRGAAQRTVDNAEVRFFIVEIKDIEKSSTDPSLD